MDFKSGFDFPDCDRIGGVLGLFQAVDGFDPDAGFAGEFGLGPAAGLSLND